MGKPIKKAVLIAGGYSTRMLPFTRWIPKEMLPLNGVPVIQILIEECASAGIEEIFVITRPDNTLLEDHYKENKQYRAYLINHNKSEYEGRFNVVYPNNLIVEFIQEDESLPYGDALGLLMLKEKLELEDKFLVLFADDIIFNTTSSVKKLIEHAEKTDSVITLSVAEKSLDEMLSFGNVYLSDQETGRLSHIVRKPKAGEIHTNFVMCGQSVLSNIIYDYYEKFDYSAHPELDTAITVSNIAKDHFVDTVKISGHWVTVGDPQNYLKANIARHVLTGDLSKDELIDYVNKI